MNPTIMLIIGLAVGIGVTFILLQSQKKSAEKVLAEAEKQAQQIKNNASSEAGRIKNDAQNEIREQKNEMKTQQDRIEKREEKLDAKLEEIDKRREEIEKQVANLEEDKKSLLTSKEELAEQLKKVANMTEEEAKERFQKEVEDKYEKDFAVLIEKKKKHLLSKGEEISREIVINSIQQYAVSVANEVTQTVVTIDSDDLKGRIIGKEGRNIVAFEKETGVSLIIDDTPNTIFLSSFDLFRRYVAKKSLEQLLQDKRIQPARIEEVVAQNQRDAEKLIHQLGEQVLTKMGYNNYPDEVISLVGKLRFRTSFGQNILKHSQEVAYIAEAIALQIGADPEIAKQGGLLHDLGKAIDHDIEGTHPEIGGKILRKHNFDSRIVNAAEGHHGAVPIECIETHIVTVADAISAVRPGARRANVEQYVKRLKEMEELVLGFEGVKKAYALSAGREVRVFVDTRNVSDLEAEKKAQEIAMSIEANLNYPGEVKVTLIREKRFTEYAR